MDTLRELIKSSCEKHNLDAQDLVPDDASMLPVDALDLVLIRAAKAARARGRQGGATM